MVILREARRDLLHSIHTFCHLCCVVAAQISLSSAWVAAVQFSRITIVFLGGNILLFGIKISG